MSELSEKKMNEAMNNIIPLLYGLNIYQIEKVLKDVESQIKFLPIIQSR